jgi:protein-tyrosine phosphatase
MKERIGSRFYQVSDQLWAGVYPGDIDSEKQKKKLKWLLDHNINYFINLMEPGEKNHGGQKFTSYYNELFDMAARRKRFVVVQRFPIRDMNTPTPEQMVVILDAIDTAVKNGHTVYVHCWGGHGRTGTVIGCWLARHDMARGQDLLVMIDHLRRKDPTGKPSPQTTEQRLRVVTWRDQEHRSNIRGGNRKNANTRKLFNSHSSRSRMGIYSDMGIPKLQSW